MLPVEKLLMKPSAAAAPGTCCFISAWGNNPAAQLGIQTSSTTNCTWSSVSLSCNTTAAITTDGKLFTWGVGICGETGLNSLNGVSSPVQIGTSSWSVISSGYGNTKGAITGTVNRFLYMWGSNLYGQVGSNSFTSCCSSSPVQIGNIQWCTVAVGNCFANAIDSNGFLWGWGDLQCAKSGVDACSTFGFGAITCSPMLVSSTKRDWSILAQGSFRQHSLAIDTSGSLWSWGNNLNGQLGYPYICFNCVSLGRHNGVGISTTGQLWSLGGILTGEDPTTKTVASTAESDGCSTHQIAIRPLGSQSWTTVSAGLTHQLAITNLGQLHAWGSSCFGELGLNRLFKFVTFNPCESATQAAIDLNNKLYIWGSHLSQGQLGNNTRFANTVPQQIGNNDYCTVTVGRAIAAITTTGQLFTWGFNFSGELGVGDRICRSSPVQVGTSSWTAVSASNAGTMAAIRSGGTLFTWGRGTDGELGNLASLTCVCSPIQLGTNSWIAISAGYRFFAAIRNDNTMWSWGYNSGGRLGLNIAGSGFSRSSPTQIGSNSNWAKISMGAFHGLAITTTGTLWAWGCNLCGVVGDGGVINRSSPVQIGSSSWNFISAGYCISSAITSSGTLFTWGQGTNGRLGDGTTVTKFSPTQIGSLSWSAVASGSVGWLGLTNNCIPWITGSDASNVKSGTRNSINVCSPVLALQGAHSPTPVGTSSWTAVAAGGYISLGIRNDNTLWGWGRNNCGSLGLNTTTIVMSPTQIGSGTWCRIDAGCDFSVALDSNWKLFTWGVNNSGQLGDGTTVNKSSPVAIGTSSWIAISAGTCHTVGLLCLPAAGFGSARAWGQNNVGQLGINSLVSQSSPVAVFGSYSWSAISAHLSCNTIGLIFNSLSANNLFTWGHGLCGKNGANSVLNRSRPGTVGTSCWAAVAAGTYHMFARLCQVGFCTNQLGFMWGYNNLGALSNGVRLSRSSPVAIGQHIMKPVRVGNCSWTAVAAGCDHTLAIRSGGSLFGWGGSNVGQSGIGSGSPQSSPTQIGSSNWTFISAGAFSSHGILTNNTLWGWGTQVLVSTQSSPTQIGTSSWTIVCSTLNGRFQSIASGTNYIWGIGTHFSLAMGSDVPNAGTEEITNLTQISSLNRRSSPTLIGAQSWVAVSNGSRHSLAVRGDCTLWAWGCNRAGQLGLGDSTLRSSPTQVGSSLWSAVAAGTAHSLAIRFGGTLFAWGCNYRGQLGDGSTISKNSPVQLGSESWSSVGAGGQNAFANAGCAHSMARRNNGTLWAWGHNNTGQLGINLGTVTLRCSPTQITGTWSSFSLGNYHALAINTSGQLYAWGLNSSGEIGDLTLTSRSSPVLISASSLSWTSVGASNNASMGISTSGDLYTWGSGNSGQIGNGLTANRSAPSFVGSGWTRVMVKSHSTTMAAIKTDGTLWAWGCNINGILGDNTTINRSNPVQVSSTKKFSTVDVGQQVMIGRQEL